MITDHDYDRAVGDVGVVVGVVGAVVSSVRSAESLSRNSFEKLFSSSNWVDEPATKFCLAPSFGTTV